MRQKEKAGKVDRFVGGTASSTRYKYLLPEFCTVRKQQQACKRWEIGKQRWLTPKCTTHLSTNLFYFKCSDRSKVIIQGSLIDGLPLAPPAAAPIHACPAILTIDSQRRKYVEFLLMTSRQTVTKHLCDIDATRFPVHIPQHVRTYVPAYLQ